MAMDLQFSSSTALAGASSSFAAKDREDVGHGRGARAQGSSPPWPRRRLRRTKGTESIGGEPVAEDSECALRHGPVTAVAEARGRIRRKRSAGGESAWEFGEIRRKREGGNREIFPLFLTDGPLFTDLDPCLVSRSGERAQGALEK
ncbi:Plastocyanin-like domain-containing protein [Psidium guajava]|nr:Plastocyanin-like domain-containing protein [Psidium guajava]